MSVKSSVKDALGANLSDTADFVQIQIGYVDGTETLSRSFTTDAIRIYDTYRMIISHALGYTYHNICQISTYRCLAMKT